MPIVGKNKTKLYKMFRNWIRKVNKFEGEEEDIKSRIFKKRPKNKISIV